MAAMQRSTVSQPTGISWRQSSGSWTRKPIAFRRSRRRRNATARPRLQFRANHRQSTPWILSGPIPGRSKACRFQWRRLFGWHPGIAGRPVRGRDRGHGRCRTEGGIAVSQSNSNRVSPGVQPALPVTPGYGERGLRPNGLETAQLQEWRPAAKPHGFPYYMPSQ
jgi:hypothetical protein